MKNHLISALIALVVSLGAIWLTSDHENVSEPSATALTQPAKGSEGTPAVFTFGDNNEIVPLDFTKVSEQVMDAVVHIKSTQRRNSAQATPQNPQDLFRYFFNLPPGAFPQQRPQAQPRVGSGSGVIINTEGYIVTNNHVIADADEIEVTLHDKRVYEARVIGTDPSTDLALIRIREKDLPTLSLIDSDVVKVGEWVLAVGNPFNLNSTVTAGIVSAKSRNINILQDQYAIESFIQTDAAINPGNSGGALVNLEGDLIGINTAIASPTGAYAGYGFAVPANIVRKVVEDLLKYGRVQRGFLGVSIRGIDGNLAKEKKLDVTKGVYVAEVAENSAAAQAGIKAGDVITKVAGAPVATAAKLQERIAQYRPGDRVELEIVRDGEQKRIEVELRNQNGNTELLTEAHNETFRALGAEFEPVPWEVADKLGLEGGVRVKTLYAGKITQATNMREGFIITKVDGQKVRDLDELARVLEGKKGGVLLEGYYENEPEVYYYGLGV